MGRFAAGACFCWPKDFLIDRILNGETIAQHIQLVLASLMFNPVVQSPYGCQLLFAVRRAYIHGHSSSSSHGSTVSRVLKDVHISAQLMEDFLALAEDNTNKDLETCGVLGAFLELILVSIQRGGIFYVTTLIIPKQESSSNSCQALNEEEIFFLQNEQSLFPVGWIHTHPSQSCFMSSIDLHTQFSYQVMVPEAVAIVMAPTDTTRSYGIFRLSDPDGMNILKECQETGYHPHREPADGSPIYEHCSNVYVNPNLRQNKITTPFK
ncbi:hypothetical protein Vadar_000732 [Vaccinium darrowii]|uniref:Uncharacterized protein n=1 Tax=Vaccinium darrowii TaxID=229202 RepID=A0ACB7WWX9_9ERIC|nr:hypothetical protein Vadar_000732 [Vaccinium darrowii]